MVLSQRAFADADGVRDAHLVLSTLRSRLSDSGASNAYGTSQELANQRMLTAMTDTISQLKELRAKTYDPALRTFYYRTGLALSDLNDLLTVEKTLILATENDNLGLWKGAAEAFANEELKRLAAPAASTLELQIRLRDFDKTYRRTQDGVARQLQAANSDLMRERNIDFSDDLHGLFH